MQLLQYIGLGEDHFMLSTRSDWGSLLSIILVAILVLGISEAASAIAPTSREISDARAWTLRAFDGKGRYTPGESRADLPFSFVYGGTGSGKSLRSWKMTQTRSELDDKRTKRTFTWVDPKTSLEVRCVLVEYRDFPTVEWTLYFRNQGKTDTPVIESICALDTVFCGTGQGDFVLHHNRGDLCAPNSYEPLVTTLTAGCDLRFAPVGGRPSNVEWPYYNLQFPGRKGVIIALGWPGQWMSQFSSAEDSVRVRGGQQFTHFVLHPGEEVRSPLVAMQFYQGDWTNAQNVWRRWMLAHNLPGMDGRAPRPVLAAPLPLDSSQRLDKETIDRWAEERIQMDYLWRDAGWYPMGSDGWCRVGTWEEDKSRYPDGLRAITDYAESKGMKSIVWFEPERVSPETELHESPREWLLEVRKGKKRYRRHGSQYGADSSWIMREAYRNQLMDDDKLFNLGNPEARSYLTELLSEKIKAFSLDVLRIDFNIGPLEFWLGNDSPDRLGMTEIRYVEGFLGLMDDLRARYPGMLIDSCSSGGRRVDLETMRRALPFLISDYEGNAVADQCHNYGFSMWIPFHEKAAAIDAYSFRSALSPMLVLVWDIRNRDLNVEPGRSLIAQWRRVANYVLFGDMYTLTPYSTKDDVWMAWQYHNPDVGEGVVQAFRRSEAVSDRIELRLRSLEKAKRYEVTNLDTQETIHLSGRELMGRGLLVTIPSPAQAALIAYKMEN